MVNKRLEEWICRSCGWHNWGGNPCGSCSRARKQRAVNVAYVYGRRDDQGRTRGRHWHLGSYGTEFGELSLRDGVRVQTRKDGTPWG